jgi:spore coat polysaccharide biosynthesis protein SpsF (cytidylyltransferase family)
MGGRMHWNLIEKDCVFSSYYTEHGLYMLTVDYAEDLSTAFVHLTMEESSIGKAEFRADSVGDALDRAESLLDGML